MINNIAMTVWSPPDSAIPVITVTKNNITIVVQMNLLIEQTSELVVCYLDIDGQR